MPRFLLLLLALPLLACPPSRSSGTDDDDSASDDDDATADDDDDDDDATTIDDDDATIDPPPPPDDDDTPSPDDDDDDDDDTPPDDDDIVDSCGEMGSMSVWFDASAGDVDGTWFEGELAWDGSNLSVAPDFGPALAISVYGTGVDLDSLFGFVAGPGRIMVAATSWGAWTANGVLAVQSDWSADSVVLGVNSPSVAAVEELGYSLSVEPMVNECTVPLFDVDGCGEGAALPLEVEVTNPWTASIMTSWPDTSSWASDGQFNQYQGWQVFELLCDDFDSPGYSWSYRVYGDVDG